MIDTTQGCLRNIVSVLFIKIYPKLKFIIKTLILSSLIIQIILL